MKISEVIKMLQEAKETHGDVDVWVDMDYGYRDVEEEYEHEKPENSTERIII